MSARLPFPLPDPAANPLRQPDDIAPGTATAIKLTDEDITRLVDFFALLEEWDRKSKIT